MSATVAAFSTPPPASAATAVGFQQNEPPKIHDNESRGPNKPSNIGLEVRDMSYFVSRDQEMDEIESTLFPTSVPRTSLGHRSVLISGIGGIGKTELAYNIVGRCKEKFDAMFFVTADSESRIREQYSAAYEKLEFCTEPVDRKQGDYSEMFRLWLNEPNTVAPGESQDGAKMKWLLVFDNVQDPQIICKFWPTGNHGCILLTSRNPLLSSPKMKYTRRLHLEGVSVKDGARLLRLWADDGRVIDDSSQQSAETLSQRLGGTPMILKQLGCIMHKEQLSSTQCFQMLPTEPALIGYLYEKLGNGSGSTGIWSLLSMEKANCEAWDLFCSISMLDADHIERRLLATQEETVNDLEQETATERYEACCRHLVESSLIEINPVDQSIQAHRLVQSLALAAMAHNGQLATVFTDTLARVADQWPFLNRSYVTGTATKIDRWERCKMVTAHIARLVEIFDDYALIDVKSAPGLELTELLLELVQFRVECGLGHEIGPLLDKVLQTYSASILKDSITDEHFLKYFRGKFAQAVIARDADNMLHYAKRIWLEEVAKFETSGVESSFLAVAYNDLAVAWACHCEWDKSIKLLEESKNIRQRLPRFTRDKLFSPLYHHALVLHHQGKYDEAEDMLNQAIADREAVFGPDDVLSIRSAALLCARGNVKFARSDDARHDMDNSLVDHLDAVSRAERSTGAAHRATITCQYYVALVYARQGKTDMACLQLKDALSKAGDRPFYSRQNAAIAFLYGQCLQMSGQSDEAAIWLGKSLNWHNILRPQHQRTIQTLFEEDIRSLAPYDFL